MGKWGEREGRKINIYKGVPQVKKREKIERSLKKESLCGKKTSQHTYIHIYTQSLLKGDWKSVLIWKLKKNQ